MSSLSLTPLANQGNITINFYSKLHLFAGYLIFYRNYRWCVSGETLILVDPELLDHLELYSNLKRASFRDIKFSFYKTDLDTVEHEFEKIKVLNLIDLVTSYSLIACYRDLQTIEVSSNHSKFVAKSPDPEVAVFGYLLKMKKPKYRLHLKGDFIC